MKVIIFSVLNYIVGSIPWALVIGKVFYNTDVREHGSGNLGATNAGRVLGKKVAYIVTVLDALKGFIMFMILSKFDYKIACFTIIFVTIGHCYPLFANLVPVLIWFLISNITEYISLASLVATFLSVILSTFVCKGYVTVSLLMIWLLIVYKHKENINRLLKGTENKKNY